MTKQNYKITVVGLGYVGLSNAALLSQKNEVVGVDLDEARVQAVNSRLSPIIDSELSDFLRDKPLYLSAVTDLKVALDGADYVIISTPTNYDEQSNYFDTSSVQRVIAEVATHQPSATVIVKSTIPVGFIDEMRAELAKVNA